MMSRLSLFAQLGAVLLAGSAWAQGPPASSEFQINFFTTGTHVYPAVGRADNGDFVAVWQFGSQALMRGFDGQAVSRFEGVVESLPDTNQGRPKVAQAPSGEFVVAWNHEAVYGVDGVRARRFDAEGNPDGSGFMMSNSSGGYQEAPALAWRPNGGFIVAWQGGALDTDTSESSVQAELFDSAGNSEGTNFLVNTSTTGFQYLPSVAAATGGRMLVVWSSEASTGTDSDLGSVQARMFEPNGAPSGPDFQVNSYTTGRQAYAAVAARPDGGFIVVWSGAGVGDDRGVFGQLLDEEGAAIGGEFQVNSYSTSTQEYPVVAGSENGFVVAWQSYGSPGDDASYGAILARTFDSSGQPKTTDFQVNTLTDYYQRYPSVAATSRGDFIVAWQGTGSVDGDTGQSAAGRLYYATIFADGFESGDTSAWSVTVD